MLSETENKFKKENRTTVFEKLMSSFTGAVLTSVFVTPFDVVKTRLQMQEKTSYMCSLPEKCVHVDISLKAKFMKCCKMYKAEFSGTTDAFKKITRSEGFSSLWSGLIPTLAISVPSNVVYFTLYDELSEKLTSYLNVPSKSTLITLISGASARVLTGTLVSPVDFFRTKVQSENIKSSAAFKALLQSVRHHGILSLWHGWAPSMLRDVPFSAVYWTMYEYFKSENAKPTGVDLFLYGFVSGTVACTITLPFDVVKTLRQSELGNQDPIKGFTKINTFTLLKILYERGGINSVFAGLVPRILKVAPACAIMIFAYEEGKEFFVARKSSQPTEYYTKKEQ